MAISLVFLSAKLAKQELAYIRVFADFTTYDDRVIRGFYFESIPDYVADVDRPCSKRYLDVLIKVKRVRV